MIKNQQEKSQKASVQDHNQTNKNNDNSILQIQNEFLMTDDIEDFRKLIIVLEQAPLETASIRQQIVLLNSDDHKNYISSRLKVDYSTFRPDIVHQSLLTLCDSPLNKRGLLKIYIRTSTNAIIDINPKLRVPRTYKRFACLMAQCLTKLRVRAVESSETLLKVIKNPITDHLPSNSLKVGTSCKAEVIKSEEYFRKRAKNGPIVVVVGAVSKGNPGMENDYVDESISISKYPLSASYCLSKIVNTFEDIWEVK